MTAISPYVRGVRVETWLRSNIVLIVLASGCLVMSLLAIEQNRTIVSQRDLIRSLYRDSIELNAMKLQQNHSAPHR